MQSTLRPLILILLFSGLSFALTSVSSCQVLDNITDTDYQLSAQLDGASIPVLELSGSTCLLMNYSNIVFDCNGFDIVNDELPGATSKMAIYVNGSTTNVTIRNCPSIESYKYGIFANGADRLNISGNLLYYNQYGIYLSGSDYNVIDGNDMRSSTMLSVYIQASDHNSFTGNMFNKSTLGGGSTGTSVTIASTSDHNNFTDNDFTKAVTGLSSAGSYNRFTDNRFYDCYGASSFSGADYNTLVGNNVSSMSNSGFVFSNSDYNVIEWNIFTDGRGFSLDSTCYRNNMSHNYASGNGYFSINGQYNRMINNTGYMMSGISINGGTYHVVLNNSLNLSGGFSMTATRMLFENNRAENCGARAFYLLSSSESNYTDNYAYNCTDGFRIIGYSDGNMIVNNTVLESEFWDLFLEPNTPDYCGNNIENLTGSGYRQVFYANDTATLQDTEVAEVALCGAHSSVLHNVTVHGSDSALNNGFLVVFTNNSVINSSDSSTNYYGIYSVGSAHNNYTGNTLSDNWQGMEIRGDNFGATQFPGSFNLIDNNTVGGSSHYGISDSYLSPSNTYTNNLIYDSNYSGLISSQDSIYIANNTVYNNGLEGTYYYGIQLSSSDAVLGDNLIYDNQGTGLYLTNVQGLSSVRDHFYDNGYDVYVESTFALDYSMTEALFDSSSGALENFTNVSISDSMAVAAEYYINSTVNYDSPPLLKAFNEKSLDITRNSGTVSIDSVAWHWTDGELSGADESLFALYQYSSGVWTLINDTPDVSGNSLTVSNLDPGSDFAILLPENCPIIDANGSYSPAIDYTGARHDAYPLTGLACVVINASDVEFDCDGHTITNNGTGGQTYGILLNTSDNVTIRNCYVADYYHGIYAYYTTDSLFTNNSVYNATNGHYLHSSSNNVIEYSRANATTMGFYVTKVAPLDQPSQDNRLEHNTAYNSTSGFRLYDNAQRNNLTNNTAYEGVYGFVAEADSSNNRFVDNVAYDQLTRGFEIITDSLSNVLEHNTVHDSATGIRVRTGHGTNVTSNTLYNNSMGLQYLQADNGTLANNEISGSDVAGLQIGNADNIAVLYGHYYNNTDDIQISEFLGTGFAMSLTGVVLDDPAGIFQNYTNLSITDNVDATSVYYIRWTTNAAALPSYHIPFAQKFVNISVISGTSSIDSITWNWQDGELGSQSESRFRLYQYNASGWTLMNGTPDTSANTLSLSALSPSSDYAILEDLTAPPSGGDGARPSEGELHIRVTAACNGFVVHALDGNGDPVEDVFVEVTDEYGNEQAKYTDSSGEAFFSPCGMDVTVTAVKSGVGRDSWTGFAECGLCGECTVDDDCPDIYHCIAEQCVPVPCDCGQVTNHQCEEYQCCADTDCPEGKSCVNHECTFGCQSDDDCLASQHCDIAEGEAGGTCTEIECRCGMIAEHACIEYQCCADPDCPEGMVCLANKCVRPEVTCPSTGLIGDDKDCNAKQDGEACVYCDFQITGPDGRTYFGQTDEEGNFEVPLRLRGIYTVTLLKDGQVVRTINVEALPRPVIGEGEKPATSFADIAQAFLLIFVVVLLLVALTYLRRRGKRLKL